MSTYPNRPAPGEIFDELRERGYTPNDRIRAFGTSQDAFDYDTGTLAAVRVITEEGEVTEVHLLDSVRSPVWSIRTTGLTTMALTAILDAAEHEADVLSATA